jgi:hypothetical protein
MASAIGKGSMTKIPVWRTWLTLFFMTAIAAVVVGGFGARGDAEEFNAGLPRAAAPAATSEKFEITEATIAH